MMAAAAAQAGRGPRLLGSDTLSRLLDDLCRPGALERRREGERSLCEYVEAEARGLTADAFAKFMNEVYGRLQAMIKRCARVKRGVCFACCLCVHTGSRNTIIIRQTLNTQCL